MHSLLKSLDSFNNHQDYVVAIILETNGSTYRKTGAMMLVDQNLNYWGLLSGGCLEGDIVHHCKKVFSEKKDQIIDYNMRDEIDMLWGMGLGCDGEISILLKYLPTEEKHHHFFSALNQLNNGISQRLLINKSADYSLKFESSTNHLDEKNKNTILIDMQAPHHLLICGGAPDVVPVTAIANQIGWKSTVIDHREDYAKKNNFPQANHVQLVKRSMWNDFELNLFDSAIIMSHQFQRDQAYVSRLLKTRIPYIGLLGPSKRRDKILKQCDTEYSKLQGRFFAPIGLDIGADSPETIALAIICEIQAVIKDKSSENKIKFCYQDVTR